MKKQPLILISALAALTVILLVSLAVLRMPNPAGRNSASGATSVKGAHPFTAPNITVTTRLLDGAADAEFQEALQQYRAGEYTVAANGFYKASSVEPSASAPHFLLGICYLMSKDVRLAIRELRIVTTLENSEFTELAHLYLAKAYIRQGDPADAHRELDAVLLANGKMKAEAEQIKLQLASN